MLRAQRRGQTAAERSKNVSNYQLYNGDSIEILEQLPKVKAIITDPPYMITPRATATES